jgi:hypothetical protein
LVWWHFLFNVVFCWYTCFRNLEFLGILQIAKSLLRCSFQVQHQKIEKKKKFTHILTK